MGKVWGLDSFGANQLAELCYVWVPIVDLDLGLTNWCFPDDSGSGWSLRVMAWVSLDVFRCLVISGDGRRGWYLVGVSKIEGCSELSMFLLRVSADQLFLFLGRSQKRAASILGARISREQQDAKMWPWDASIHQSWFSLKWVRNGENGYTPSVAATQPFQRAGVSWMRWGRTRMWRGRECMAPYPGCKRQELWWNMMSSHDDANFYIRYINKHVRHESVAYNL